MKTKEKTVTATEFKVKCIWILEHLGPGGVVITKRGRPVARVMPVTPDTSDVREVRGEDALKFPRPVRPNPHEPSGPVDNSKLFGSMKGKIKILGDIFSTGEKWDAES